MTTTVCQSCAFPEHQATLHTGVSQRTPFLKTEHFKLDINAAFGCSDVFSFPQAMYFPSPISCERNGAKVTKFKRSSKYSLHLPSIFSLLSRTPFLSLMDLAILEFLSRRTSDGLPEHLVGLPVNGI